MPTNDPSSLPGPTETERTKTHNGHTVKMRTGCGSLYVTVNSLEGRPFELFIRGGKAGGCEAIGILISLAWRNGASADEVVRQLKGISCQRPFS